MNLNEAKLLIEETINKEVEVIKRFSGGMSNYTYLIKMDNELYTYRIPGKNSEVFIDRITEEININLVKSLNVNCNNVYFNQSNGHKMALYIEGEDLSNVEFDYKQVANELKKLHNSNIKANNDYNKIEKLNYYEKLHSYNLSDDYILLKKRLLILLDNYKDIELVFCHGDAQKANWILSGRLYLLDWEYSGNNDPYYDIACFGNVNFNDAIELLKHYLNKEPNNNELNRLIVNRLFQCLQWHNVALYKEEIGLSKDLNIDFKFVSNKYITLAKEFIDMIK